MTNLEAIEELKYQEAMRSNGADYQVNNLVIGAAISALEKQTPKSAVITPNCAECEKESCDGCLSDNYGFSVTLCPNCKEVVENRNNGDVSTYNYCPNCGQALDWGENPKD